eukprot:736573-Prorocentrum_lima.AAC.1
MRAARWADIWRLKDAGPHWHVDEVLGGSPPPSAPILGGRACGCVPVIPAANGIGSGLVAP